MPEGPPDYTTLDLALDSVLAPLRSGPRPLGLLFSGGVDSALLAWELRREGRPHLYTVGLAGSPDLQSAQSTASALGLPWTGSVVSPDDVEAVARGIASELEGLSPVMRSVQVAFTLAVDRAEDEHLLCGQGADELFLGYAHYSGLGLRAAEERSASDLERLRHDDWPRSRRIALALGKQLGAPYLEEPFVRAALAVPLRLRLPGNAPKAYFRTWARHRGLPEEIAERAKRALQYGTGIDRALRSRDRARREPLKGP